MDIILVLYILFMFLYLVLNIIYLFESKLNIKVDDYSFKDVIKYFLKKSKNTD